MKATHKGTCQACGSTQRLPNDKLSNHGYTVKWDMFQGVCQGSKELPFEKSCALIETFISRAKAQILGLQNEIEEIRQYKGNLGWHKAYYNGEYTWAQVPIIEAMIKDGMFIDQNGKKCYFNTYSYYCNTVEEAVKRMNETRIYFYNQKIKKFNSYIEWQELRVKDWKETDLYPIKE